MNNKEKSLPDKSNKFLEQTIIPVLQKKGFSVASFINWQNSKDKYGDELLLLNVPYTTIYGHKGRTGFLLKSKKYNLEIRIECKWQQSAGSVDEKFPYLYLNCIEAMKEEKIFIILDGNGYRKEAKQWLKNSIENNKYKNKENKKCITLFNLTEFLSWVNKNL